jgi:hypothetical protein
MCCVLECLCYASTSTSVGESVRSVIVDEVLTYHEADLAYLLDTILGLCNLTSCPPRESLT